MRKLGVHIMPSSRTANCIGFFVSLRRENIRLLDKLFLRLSRLTVNSTGYITVIDSEGDTGMYNWLPPTRSSIFNIAYVLGFNLDEINAYVNRK